MQGDYQEESQFGLSGDIECHNDLARQPELDTCIGDSQPPSLSHAISFSLPAIQLLPGRLGAEVCRQREMGQSSLIARGRRVQAESSGQRCRFDRESFNGFE